MTTTGDDKILNYLSESSVQTFEGHNSDVSFAVYRLVLPIIVIGFEGGTV